MVHFAAINSERTVARVGHAANGTLHHNRVADVLGLKVEAHLAAFWELFTLRVDLYDEVDGARLIDRGHGRVLSRKLVTIGSVSGLTDNHMIRQRQAHHPARIRELELEEVGVRAELCLLDNLKSELVVLVLLHQSCRRLCALRQIEILYKSLIFGLYHVFLHKRIIL